MKNRYDSRRNSIWGGLMLCIVGIGVLAYGNSMGLGFIIAGIVVALVSIYAKLKKPKDMRNIMSDYVRDLLCIAAVFVIVGVCLSIYGNNIGDGLIIGGTADAVLALIIGFKQTGDRIKRFEEEIELLKKK